MASVDAVDATLGALRPESTAGSTRPIATLPAAPAARPHSVSTNP